MRNDFATRGNILQVARDVFSVNPEYLWHRYPNYAVLRHPNKKWFGVVMDIERNKLGLVGVEKIDILVIQCSPIVRGSLEHTHGILPAYHMNKANWITVLLDGSVGFNECCALLDMSYEITENKKALPTQKPKNIVKSDKTKN